MKFRKFSKTQMCPTCQSTEVYCLKRQGIANRLVCKFSDYRPLWCANCDTLPGSMREPYAAKGLTEWRAGPSHPRGPRRTV